VNKDKLRGGELRAQAEQIDRDLSAIRSALRKPLDVEESKGQLTIPQKAVMQIVVRNHGLSLKELCKQVHLAHSTVSGIIDRLTKRGMIERRADSKDRRLARIYPTKEVQKFISNLLPSLTHRPLEEALKRATKVDRALILDAVRRLRELLDDPPA
jgi:DNA-binding MarR family transcriptional regulator